MSTLNIILGQESKCLTIPIGHIGENIVEAVAFDFSAWAEEYGTGTIQLLVQRNGDTDPYPVTLTVDETVATWTISDTDTAVLGMGECQLIYTVGDAVKKSKVYQFNCVKSLGAAGDAPDPYETWLDTLMELASETQANADSASNSATNALTYSQQASESATLAQEYAEQAQSASAHAPVITDGYWYVWDSATEQYVSTGIKAQGEDGTDGTDGVGIQSIEKTGTSGNVDTYTITFTDGSTYSYTVTNADMSRVEALEDDVTDIMEELTQLEVTGTASGAIASFDDGADGKAVKSLTIAINPVQSGSGDPSPTNVRPISGWTGAEVVRAGANLWGGEKLRDNIQTAVPEAVVDVDAKTVAFWAGHGADKMFTNIPFESNTQYTIVLTFSNTVARTNMRWVYTDGTATTIVSTTTGKQTIVSTSNSGKTVAYIGGLNSDGRTVIYYEESGVFNGTVTASDFVAYAGTTYPITFPSTVYGGTLEVTTGVLTVDRAMVEYDASDDEVWHEETGSNWQGLNFYVAKPANMARVNYTYASNMTNKISIGGTYQDYIMISSGYINVIWGQLLGITSLADWKAWLAEHPLQISYQLTEPITYTLTPTEVTTLLGDNNIYADTGDVDVVYVRDLNIVINKLLS